MIGNVSFHLCIPEYPYSSLLLPTFWVSAEKWKHFLERHLKFLRLYIAWVDYRKIYVWNTGGMTVTGEEKPKRPEEILF
jgi:hypothetical protein